MRNRTVILAVFAGLASPAAASCTAAPGAAVLVHVDGFKAHTGTLRVQVYGDNPADWLAKGKKLRRVDVPVVPVGGMEVCVTLPGPGKYAVAVRHDVDGNGKSGWNDGGGFSRNPTLSVLHLKPAFGAVVFPVGDAPRTIEVVLQYRQGLSIRPVGRG